jgi:hypothetical protein
MSEAETRLADFWASTDAPSRDLAFALAVEERIARRLMLIDVAGRVTVGLIAIAALVVFAPALLALAGALVGSLDPAGPVLAAVAVLGAVMIRLTRPPVEAWLGDFEDPVGPGTRP